MSLSHRWVLWVGRRSKGRGASLVFMSIGMAFTIGYLADDSRLAGECALGCLLLSLIYFERATYYHIIETKNAEIAKMQNSVSR
jgi:hypothetical protein